MPLYNVHLFPVVQAKVQNVEAETPEAAVRKARDQYLELAEDWGWTLLSWDRDEEETGLTEVVAVPEFVYYQFDVVGDEEYLESAWFLDEAHREQVGASDWQTLPEEDQ